MGVQASAELVKALNITAAQELWGHKNGMFLPFINVGTTRMRQVVMLSLWSCDTWPNLSTPDQLCASPLSAELLFLCLWV
jgi:hypothetical protein